MADSELDYKNQREALVEEIQQSAGTVAPRVLEAIRRVPRHEFVPQEHRQYAYENRPLPIGHRQTISQPVMVAIMTTALDVQEDHIVMEIGTGSGYQAAILAELCRQVYTLERHPELADSAAKTLARLVYDNIKVVTADGSQGFPERAPFDRILVTAGSPSIPQELVRQLKIHGKMVAPVGDYSYQSLTLVEMTPSGTVSRELTGCVFVPLIGKFGWPQERVDDEV